MDKNKLIDKLYIKSDKWMRAVASNILIRTQDVEDVIADVYLYLLEMENIDKIMYGNELNLFYIYKIIRSKALGKLNEGKRVVELSEVGDNGEEEYDESFDKMLESVRYTMDNNIHWFNKKLLEVYVYEEHSITSLSEATKISRSTIWNTLNVTKKFIREEYEKGKD